MSGEVTTSGIGTNRTKWAGLTVSAYRGRPEVTGEAYKARNPSRSRYHSCCLTVVVTTGRIQYALHRQPVPNRRLVLRSEVTGEAYKARNPSRSRYHSCCLTVVVTTGRIQYALHRHPVPNRRLVL